MKYNTPQEILAWIVQKKDDLPTTASKSEGRLLHGIIRELQSNIHISQKDTTEHIEEIIKDTNRETVFRCRFCGSEHRVYKLYFSISHLEILKKIYIYCINNKTNTFNKKDLDLTHTEYGNFPFLKRFGLIYLERPEKEKTY